VFYSIKKGVFLERGYLKDRVADRQVIIVWGYLLNAGVVCE
jgi:hypothetical protein